MNIKHENVPGLLQEVVFEISKEDYAANLEAALKKQRRAAAVPGFRVGNAPMGMIKKM
ncbi:MAG: trigger factor family protein [Bacteroidales bacterium]|nr:trigger factor family protein [Bacteroidales bacterium]